MSICSGVGRVILEDDHAPAPGIDVDDDDYDGADGIDFRLLEDDDEDEDEDLVAAFGGGPIPGVESLTRPLDAERLKAVLQDLIACRQLLDSALKEG